MHMGHQPWWHKHVFLILQVISVRKREEKEDIQARGRRHTRRAQFKWFVWDKPSQSG
jgi:hypothetical protein